jgi:hypothetical protein
LVNFERICPRKRRESGHRSSCGWIPPTSWHVPDLLSGTGAER